METAPSRSGSAPAGELVPNPPAASTARNPPLLVPPEANAMDEPETKKKAADQLPAAGKNDVSVSSDGDDGDDGDGSLAARAAALLDAGAADAWLTSRAGGASVSDAPRRSVDAPTPAPKDSFSSSPSANASSSPLTPAERAGLDPTRIHSLAARATAEMVTLRGELASERARTKTYAAELGRLRAAAESRVAAGVAAVSSAADSARDAAAVRADVIARATAAESHAAAFYRRATEAERLLRVERDRNASLVAALNAAGTAAAAATRALVERAKRAERLARETEARAADAEARADEAVGIARAATRNAADTARVAGLERSLPGEGSPSRARAGSSKAALSLKRAANVVGAATKMRASSSAGARHRDIAPVARSGGSGSPARSPRVETTPRRTSQKNARARLASAFAPPSESEARAASPGRRCAACAARRVAPRGGECPVTKKCAACDDAIDARAHADRVEVSVPTVAGGAAATNAPRAFEARVSPRRARFSTTGAGRDAGSGDSGEDDEDDEDDLRGAPGLATPSRVRDRDLSATAPEPRREARAETAEARLAELESRAALAAAELERERRDERRADASPGAENRRRRRRERAEVAAKLDATEARLSAMRLEDARKARAKADSVTEASRRAPRGV